MPAPPDAAPRPVRVSFVIDNLSRAGTETQLLALLRGLNPTRVIPTLVLLDGEGETSRALEPAGCPVIRLGVTKLFGRHAARAAWRLRYFWRESPPDVVVAYFLDSAYLAAPVARLCGVRHVVRVRNNLGYWLTPRHRRFNRAVRPFVNHVLTNSATGRDALLRTDRLRPDAVTVIENGVDLERYCGLPRPFSGSGPRRVGCVANLRPVKNIDGLMRAARQVLGTFPDVRFEVAGEGEERPRLERLHAELGLGERFVFRGSVADVPAFLGSLDVAVLPSHSEGMSNALLEFMAAGRAVVATEVGANALLIHDGVTGRIVRPGDEARLAEVLGEVLSDPATAIALGAAARKSVEASYGRAAMVRRFEDFFHAITATDHGRRRAPRPPVG